MKQNPTPRTLAVVWKWADPKDGGIPMDTCDAWKTESGDCLLRLDTRTREKLPGLLQAAIAHENLGRQPLLVLLHHGTPHPFGEADRQAIETAFSMSENTARARLFGGGREQLYFSAQYPLGILGLRGRLPRTVEIYQPEFQIIESDFVLDEAARRINQTHFDFVWQAYWQQPQQRILELCEELRIGAFGYVALPPASGISMSSFLRQQPVLWSMLRAFAAENGAPQRGEFDMRAYRRQLEANGAHEVIGQFDSVQAAVKSLLGSSLPPGPEAETALEEVYQGLNGLATALPEDAA
jgi:hypothetical protein